MTGVFFISMEESLGTPRNLKTFVYAMHEPNVALNIAHVPSPVLDNVLLSACLV
jgi:hypothetical protein